MADNTPVNPQITDAVTQANVRALGDAPAMAMGMLHQTLCHSTGILFQNAVVQQQQQAVTLQATTTQGVTQIFSIDTSADGVATGRIAQSDVPDTIAALLTALRAAQ